jgi:hypothetical protein
VRLTDTLPLNTAHAAGPWVTSGQAGYAAGTITWTGAVTVGEPVTIVYQVTTVPTLAEGTWIANSALLYDLSSERPITLVAVATTSGYRLYLPLVRRGDL